jgi:hypothetical protein
MLGSFEFFAKNKTKNGPENFFGGNRSEKKNNSSLLALFM